MEKKGQNGGLYVTNHFYHYSFLKKNNPYTRENFVFSKKGLSLRGRLDEKKEEFYGIFLKNNFNSCSLEI